MHLDDVLTELVEHSGDQLLRVAYQLTHDAAAAQDLVQKGRRSCLPVPELTQAGPAAPCPSPQPHGLHMARECNRNDVTSLRIGPSRCYIVAVASGRRSRAPAPRGADGTPGLRQASPTRAHRRPHRTFPAARYSLESASAATGPHGPELRWRRVRRSAARLPSGPPRLRRCARRRSGPGPAGRR